MPALETPVKRATRKPLPSDLSDLDRLLLERQDDGFDRIEASLEKIIARTPDPRLILATAGSLIVGTLTLVFYLVTLLAKGQGIDTGAAVRETRQIIEVVAPAAGEPAPEADPVVVPTEPPTEEMHDG